MRKREKEKYGGPTSQFHNRRRAALEAVGADTTDSKTKKARECFNAPSYYQICKEKRQ